MISDLVRFWLYLVFLLPSILCSLFILYHFLFDHVLRQSVNNHVLTVVLLCGLVSEVTIYPWMLYFYQHGISWYRADIVCDFWAFIDWGVYLTQIILFSWASLERHILIFQSGWIGTKKKCFFVHYLPLIGIVLYCCLYYMIVVFFPPCQKLYAQSYMICVYMCAYENYVLYMWETIVHQILPNLLIVISNVALLLRVIRQKKRLNQRVEWRKYRKMAVQILSISLLYLIFSFPLSVMSILQLTSLSYVVTSEIRQYGGFFSYYLMLLFPFVCLLSLPDLREKTKRLLCLQRFGGAVVPVTLTHNPTFNRQTRIQ